MIRDCDVAITAASVSAYRHRLQEQGNKPSSVRQRLIELHDAALAVYPGQNWGWLRERANECKVRRVGSRTVLCLPVRDWPAEEARKWQAAIAPASVLDGDGRSHASAASNRKVEKGFGRYLQFERLHKLCQKESLAQRLIPARAKAYHEHLKGYGNGEISIRERFSELYAACKAIEPDSDWRWLLQAWRRLAKTAAPTRNKAERLVSPKALWDLAQELMLASGSGIRASCAYRDGLMIAFLACLPLRRKNLVELQIGVQLQRRKALWEVWVDGRATKTGRPIEGTLPAPLGAALDRYLEEHRPRLEARLGRWHAAAGEHLWISADGSPMTGPAVYQQICRHTKKHLGHSVNPHLFRDCVASAIALADPAARTAAMNVLGHASFETTEHHYTHGQQQAAVRAYHARIDQLRKLKGTAS